MDRRLREAKAAQDAKTKGRPHAGAAGLGVAWRLSLELVAAFAVGGLLGYGIDVLAKSAPWGLLIGLGFGFAAGVRNVVRAASEMQAAAGERPPGEEG